MKPGGSTALAIGAGYVLGRQHKLRAAVMMGAAAAAGRMAARGNGGQQGESGGDQGESHGSGLIGKLGGAGRTAAVSAFARSADRIGDRLTERAASMRQDGSGGEDK